MTMKPTGTIGPIKVDNKGINFQKIGFPKAKAEVELFIVERFFRSINSRKKVIDKVEQNSENDFDFTVYVKKQVSFLELMEIKYLDGGYDIGTGSYKDLEMARFILGKIQNKSDRYTSTARVDLLIYPTDYKFQMSNTCIGLLGYLLSKSNLKFKGIFYFNLLDEDSGYANLIYPREYEEIDVETFKENTTYNLDPTKWKFISASQI